MSPHSRFDIWSQEILIRHCLTRYANASLLMCTEVRPYEHVHPDPKLGNSAGKRTVHRVLTDYWVERRLRGVDVLPPPTIAVKSVLESNANAESASVRPLLNHSTRFPV